MKYKIALSAILVGVITTCVMTESDSNFPVDPSSSTSTLSHPPPNSAGGYIESIDQYDLSKQESTRNEDQSRIGDLENPLQTLTVTAPVTADVLMHMNLMSGNSLSDKVLLDKLGRKGEEPSVDLMLRVVLYVSDPDSYHALKHYEQHVLGKLANSNRLKDIINSQEFLDYRDYLVQSGIQPSLCSDSPKSLSCPDGEYIE